MSRLATLMLLVVRALAEDSAPTSEEALAFSMTSAKLTTTVASHTAAESRDERPPSFISAAAWTAGHAPSSRDNATAILIDIFLASDRPLPTAATLNSVCANTDSPSRLRFHLVTGFWSMASEPLEKAISNECRGAVFVAWSLPELEDEVEKVRGRLPVWLRPSLYVPNEGRLGGEPSTSPFAVHVPSNELDAKHASAFNHGRFYMAEILEARRMNAGERGVNYLLLLDDDVIVQRDVLELVAGGTASKLTGAEHGKVMGAGCSNWVYNGDTKKMDYTTEASYLNVPYFGFGAIDTRSRSVADAECKSPGQTHCIPPGLLSHLGDVAQQIEATTPPTSGAPTPPEQASFADALDEANAWNFGFVLVDVEAWASNRVTDRFELWLEENARKQIFPSDSLAFGLGLPYLALRDDVQCFEHGEPGAAVHFEQGLGIMPWSDMEDAGRKLVALEKAFAIHFNGGMKPWDTLRCVDSYHPLSPSVARFAKYAEMSRPLYSDERSHQDDYDFCQEKSKAIAPRRKLSGSGYVDATGGICFPGDATVVLQGGTTIKIRDLKVRGLWNAREAGTVHI